MVVDPRDSSIRAVGKPYRAEADRQVVYIGADAELGNDPPGGRVDPPDDPVALTCDIDTRRARSDCDRITADPNVADHAVRRRVDYGDRVRHDNRCGGGR